MTETLNVGLNGFGRFGLHLLKYWLDRNEEAPWKICWINDDHLSLKDAYRLMLNDEYVIFNKYKIYAEGDTLTFLQPNGRKHVLQYTNAPKDQIPWAGEPDLFFECSGKNTIAQRCDDFLTGRTKQVLISATSWDADTTLVYGFNHQDWHPDLRTISYGSCTVNGFVPLAQWFNAMYGVVSSDVNVIHNEASHKRGGETLLRKFCTLEKSGPQLLQWLPADRFIVNYTVVPYSGVSMMDMRFRCQRPPTVEQLAGDLSLAMADGGPLAGLYDMDVADIGPEVYNCTAYSAVIIRNAMKVLHDEIYFQTYFDTENSVNRYYDLSSFVARKMLGQESRDAGKVVAFSQSMEAR
ncbi:glyceraldehyde 3-phosphate dehydrogenase [Sphingobium faniae]|nr:glyceraldehyde 3-phosphate dehydrogenase [Sphingobium faniae]